MRWRQEFFRVFKVGHLLVAVWYLLVIAVAALPWQYQNDVLDGDLGDLQCSRMIGEVRRTEATLSARLPPDLSGTWVSQSCEVRPGPEFLLRKYKFLGNSSFELLQFYYADYRCSTPTHVVLAEGYLHMTDPSWTVPGGMDSDYFLSRVQVKAYSADIAEVLAAQANRSCPGHVVKPWHALRWHTMYLYVEAAGGAVGNDVEVTEDVDCLAYSSLVFHELQLLRTESRKQILSKPKKGKGRRVELLLGDVHPDPEKRNNFRPTGYQAPLLKSDQMKTSAIGRLVVKATDVFPPNVRSRVVPIPLQLHGEWISTRCETRPFSLFLTRRLSFYEGSQNAWRGEYQYFLDPRCRKPLFGLAFLGRHVFGNTSEAVEGASNVDFLIDTLALTAHTPAMVSNLNGHAPGSCGRTGGWRLGVPQDLAVTSGCSGLGLKVPSRELEISKLDMDRQGDSWLYIGQPGSHADTAAPGGGRPTSYQLPLLQCRMHVREEMGNALYQLPGAPIFSARFQAAKDSGRILELCPAATMAALSFLVNWQSW